MILLKIGLTLLLIFWPAGLIATQFIDPNPWIHNKADDIAAGCILVALLGVALCIIGGLAWLWS